MIKLTMEFNDSRLEIPIEKRDWDTLSNILKPKYFPRNETGELVSPLVIARIADALTNSFSNTPEKLKIVFLKCLMNSCVNGYIHKEYRSTDIPDDNFYASLCRNYANISSNDSTHEKHGYPIFTHFPYDRVAKWAADYISQFSVEEENTSVDKLEILRLSTQFLCNLAEHKFPCVDNERLKKVTMLVSAISPENTKDQLIEFLLNISTFYVSNRSLIRHDHLPVLRAACAFVHNALTLFKENYYTDDEKNKITILLIRPVKLGIPSAIDALRCLLRDPRRLQNVYEEITIEEKLYLLESFHQELRESNPDSDSIEFSPEAISFLSKCFKRKSDLVLKTVTSYLDGTEPMEIMILLDILGALTSRTDENSLNNLQDDKSLLINCIYLLKSLHMAGKEPDNFFTPVQDLKALAPAGQVGSNDSKKTVDIQAHPAFGFKAGLIRVIGNMVHKHEANQDLIRELDGIPLLLDCCNMDARNPLIMQWTILAMRNICENNLANQDVVKGLNKIGVADNSVLKEFGITLHDEGDGKAVGIIPLNRS